jgi:squalene-hopene/tetraprenyl-beta-curcumene cyclase
MTFTLDHVKNIPGLLRVKLQTSIHKAVKYLNRQQFQDGSWVPLWFGNQFTPDKKNQVYGTAKVVSYLQDCMHQTNILDDSLKSSLQVMIDKGTRYLLLLQNPDGSWGGARNIEGSVEETALAICALVRTHKEQCRQGLQWLQNKYNSLGLVPSPIGLYFATLWYDEKMYPLVFYIEALRRYSEAYIENASV